MNIAKRLSIILLALASTGFAQEKLSGSVRAIITAYCPCVKCCGDYEGKIRGKTASGKMAQALRTLAAPKDLPFNSEIWITEGDGGGGRLAAGVCLGIVEDRGGAISWRESKSGKPVLRIDVYFPTHQEALDFGIRSADVRIVMPVQSTKKGSKI